jgi:hypothetical protein
MPIVPRMAVAAVAAVALLPACQPLPARPGTQSPRVGPPIHAEGCEPIAVDGENPGRSRALCPVELRNVVIGQPSRRSPAVRRHRWWSPHRLSCRWP